MNNFILDDFSKFDGGWSLSPYSIYLALKHLNFEGNSIKILEFGSGEGTKNLVDVLKNKSIDFEYVSVEHDVSFAKSKDVEYIMYNIPTNYTPNHIDLVELNLDKTFDLVIVDGPHGVGRANWYKKILNNVKNNTIILIDDFHHYKEFDDELNRVFVFDTINVFNIDKRFTKQIVNEGIELVDINSPYHKNKTHKIVKIKK